MRRGAVELALDEWAPRAGTMRGAEIRRAGRAGAMDANLRGHGAPIDVVRDDQLSRAPSRRRARV